MWFIHVAVGIVLCHFWQSCVCTAANVEQIQASHVYVKLEAVQAMVQQYACPECGDAYSTKPVISSPIWSIHIGFRICAVAKKLPVTHESCTFPCPAWCSSGHGPTIWLPQVWRGLLHQVWHFKSYMINPLKLWFFNVPCAENSWLHFSKCKAYAICTCWCPGPGHVQQYVCLECGEAYNTRPSISSHVSSIHKSFGIFSCAMRVKRLPAQQPTLSTWHLHISLSSLRLLRPYYNNASAPSVARPTKPSLPSPVICDPFIKLWNLLCHVWQILACTATNVEYMTVAHSLV